MSLNPIPLGNGNIYPLQEYLNAIDGIGADKFRYYLTQRDYYANEWKIEGDDELKNIWPLASAWMCDVGQVGIMRFGGRLVVIGVYQLITYPDGEVKSGKGYILRNINNYMEPLAQEVRFTGKNCVVLKFNFYSLPIWYTQEPVMKVMDLYLKANRTNAITSIAKKVLISAQNEDSEIIAKEFGTMLDPSVPYVINITNPENYFTSSSDIGGGLQTLTRESNTSLPNKIDTLDIGTSNLIEGWDAFQKHLNFWYKHFGRVEDLIDNKRERNLTGEVNNVNAGLLIVRREREKYVEQFIYFYNKTFGKNARYEPVAQIKDEASGNLAEEKEEVDGTNNTEI